MLSPLPRLRLSIHPRRPPTPLHTPIRPHLKHPFIPLQLPPFLLLIPHHHLFLLGRMQFADFRIAVIEFADFLVVVVVVVAHHAFILFGRGGAGAVVGWFGCVVGGGRGVFGCEWDEGGGGGVEGGGGFGAGAVVGGTAAVAVVDDGGVDEGADEGETGDGV